MNAKYYYFNAPSLQNVKNALIHILGVLPVDLAKDSDVPLLIQGPLLWRSPTQSIYKPQCTSSFSSQKIFSDIHALPFRYSQFPSLQNTPLSWVCLDSSCRNAPHRKESPCGWLQYRSVLGAPRSLPQWKGWACLCLCILLCPSPSARQPALPSCAEGRLCDAFSDF